METLDGIARKIADTFEQREIPYAIMGGLAVRLYGLPRATFDADFIVLLDRESLPEFYEACEAIGFSVPEPQKTGWIDLVRELPVVKLQWRLEAQIVDVDLFLAEVPFQQEVLRRRRRAGANGWKAWFVSAEDLVLLKLLAGRNKDLADVSDILLVQGELDQLYLTEWAGRLGLTDALRKALDERPQ